MLKKLELKILALVVGLLLLGVILAGIMTMVIEKRSLYFITRVSSESVANIVARNVERTMLEGRADIVKALVEDLEKTSGIEGLSVLNHEGRKAWDENAPPLEKEIMEKIASQKAPLFIQGEKNMTYYRPLINAKQCKSCHARDLALLGAAKITISIEEEYVRAMFIIKMVILATIFFSFIFSMVLWMTIRKVIIDPVKIVEQSALKMSKGDLSFVIDLNREDEIGRLSNAVQDSALSISSILQRIKDVARRIFTVASDVETASKKVVDGTFLETEAIANISSSIEEMNASISEIADGTDGLAASTEQTAASMEEMVTSITQIKDSTQDLSIAVESTSTSIEQLSATIKEVANNATELATYAEDTQSSMIQISSSVKEITQSAKESSRLSEKVRNDATTFGMDSINKTIEGMTDIKDAVKRTADYIIKLGGRSEEIGKILTVIDDITDQTTLLALNAAILAAQAGEHGKGFSVVADEIKELADRTSTSTKEISSLIQNVQQEVSDAVNAMEEGTQSVESGLSVTSEAADALRKIIESAAKSSEMTIAIERATTEQSAASRLVSEAIEKVLQRSAEIARAMKEQSKGIQLIIDATEKINHVASHVKTATNEQSLNSRQISQAVELVSDKSQQISRAINEQKMGSKQIWMSIEQIKDLPKENKDRAFRLNQMLKELNKDAELTITEMDKFTLVSSEVAAKVLRLGIVPIETPAEMFKKFSPLGRYLSEQLNVRIDLKVAVDLEGAMKDISEGITQVSFLTPSLYIKTHGAYGTRILVKALREGKPFHHSVIIAKEDSGIQSIQELKGRSFAFGDIHSTSSHIVPRAMLLDAGLDVKDLSYYNYLGHHDDVAEAVLKGDFDAGGVMESTAYKFQDRGLAFIKFSEDIPEFNICVTKSLDNNVAEAIKSSLLALRDSEPEHTEILQSMNRSYTGFTEALDEDYNSVRVMMVKLGMI
ncbi:MAG: phosphate/phosphite/phosphonate ABC transporter substrate-binding protein [Nitrospiraceae bacterium]|nr:MAG: phosphate/phosphite/phosphonate ABC transporter substrate-binding protein [Nitrospiraceae bacterium]